MFASVMFFVQDYKLILSKLHFRCKIAIYFVYCCADNRFQTKLKQKICCAHLQPTRSWMKLKRISWVSESVCLNELVEWMIQWTAKWSIVSFVNKSPFYLKVDMQKVSANSLVGRAPTYCCCAMGFLNSNPSSCTFPSPTLQLRFLSLHCPK